MKLDAVYELRDRLETAAVAGAGLIPEDFRLKRAVAQLEPYAKASPVFQKIYVMGQKLTAAECADRAGVLFDMLGLVDAVLCTQGSLQTEGSLEPLTTENNQGELYRQISYKRIAPVLEAFCGTGSGRYAVIRDAHEADPEIFGDYRIKFRMVQALGDSYGELADMAAEWLMEEGPELIPVLKKDFRPDGKKDMVRRLQVMEAIAEGEENEFYRSVLKSAKKDVREEAIRALRFNRENLPLLLELAKTEKSNCRSAVLYSMTFMDGAETEAFWRKMIEKKPEEPEEAMDYLEKSDAEWAGDIVADTVEWWFKRHGADKKKQYGEEELELLRRIWQAAVGKPSGHLIELYEKVNSLLPDETMEVLTDSLIRNPHPALCSLAEEMYGKHGDSCLEPAFVASLLTEPAKKSLERFGGYLKPAGVLSGLTGKKKEPAGLISAFARIYYSEEEKSYQITGGSLDSPVMMQYRRRRRLPSGLDPEWYSLLLKMPGRYEGSWNKNPNRGSGGTFYSSMLMALYCPDVESLAQQYGEYFYQEVLRRPARYEEIQLLKRCGWTNYKGIVASICRKDAFDYYTLRMVIQELPMTGSELADELDQVIRQKGKGARYIGYLENLRDRLRSGVSAENL